MIIPSHISSIKFDYYNPLSSKFITVELPIMLEDELISTQTNLNPNEGSLLFYKQVSSLGLLVVFILIYLKTKDKIFILPIILFGFLFIKLVLPNQKIIINKDTKVYILPTKSSTVYKIVDKRSEVEVLQKKKGFIKILFTNKNIGWIRESDVK